MVRRSTHSWLALLLLWVGLSRPVSADIDRVRHLVQILETNRSYKVRLLTIAYLGKLGDSRAVPSLVRLLVDRSPTVRRMAIASLGQIGDRRALPALGAIGHADSGGLGEQARRAIRRIEGDELQSGARVYLTVGRITNRSGRGGGELAVLLERTLLATFAKQPGVTAVGSADEMRGSGFLLDGAIVSMEPMRTREGLVLTCRIDVSVASYPGNSMQAVYRGEASVVTAGIASSSHLPELYREVVEGAAREATQRILGGVIRRESTAPAAAL